MAFVLLEFDDNSIAVVHERWLTPRKSEVFWPPFKEINKFNKALKLGDEPSGSWNLCSIKRIFHQSNDYELIQKKAILAKSQSDIDEDVIFPKKRKVNLPCRYISDDSDEDSSNLPKAPKFSPSLVRNPNILVDNLENDSGSQVPLNRISCNTTPQTLRQLPANVNTNIGCNHLNWFEKIFKSLEFIKEQNKQILNFYENERKIITNCPETNCQLPVASIENLHLFDDHLKNNNQMTNDFTKYLSTLGGKDLTNKTNRILRYIVSDHAAVMLSYFGKRSNKVPFCNFHLKDIIINAIKMKDTTTFDKDIEDAIKVWLKHAPDRVRGKK